MLVSVSLSLSLFLSIYICGFLIHVCAGLTIDVGNAGMGGFAFGARPSGSGLARPSSETLASNRPGSTWLESAQHSLAQVGLEQLYGKN